MPRFPHADWHADWHPGGCSSPRSPPRSVVHSVWGERRLIQQWSCSRLAQAHAHAYLHIHRMIIVRSWCTASSTPSTPSKSLFGLSSGMCRPRGGRRPQTPRTLQKSHAPCLTHLSANSRRLILCATTHMRRTSLSKTASGVKREDVSKSYRRFLRRQQERQERVRSRDSVW